MRASVTEMGSSDLIGCRRMFARRAATRGEDMLSSVAEAEAGATNREKEEHAAGINASGHRDPGPAGFIRENLSAAEGGLLSAFPRAGQMSKGLRHFAARHLAEPGRQRSP